MSPEKDAELCAKYPKIFINRNKTMQESPMYFGISTGEGWFDLIDTLCGELQSHVNSQIVIRKLSKDAATKVQVVAAQVKSKFSGLRFYVDGGDETTRGMINMAEAMSMKICEECGNRATVQTSGWIRNICEPCYEKEKKERKKLSEK